jgi:hypothetical protein
MSAPAEDAPRRSWLRGMWSYLLLVAAALVGIGYASTGGPAAPGSRAPSVFLVWSLILPVYFAACVWHGWDGAAPRQAKLRLVVTQALHWLAFLGAMWVALRPEVRGIMNDDGEGVMLLMLLAVGTFVAGVHAWSLPICLTGVVLALAIPAIAWIEQTALLLIVLAVCALALFGGLWLIWKRHLAPSAPA